MGIYVTEISKSLYLSSIGNNLGLMTLNYIDGYKQNKLYESWQAFNQKMLFKQKLFHFSKFPRSNLPK